jgi:DNA-binding winged helix-turn-helix (wHTH) protein/Tol biopolymer transport system component
VQEIVATWRRIWQGTSVTDAKSNGLVKFGVYEVDSRVGELRRNGLKVKLQEQPFQLLTLLLERPGELVSRDELQKRLWPSDTFVDFDHGLNAAVKRLRDALGDSAENPRFVETLARRGYRFLAPINGHVAEVPAIPTTRKNHARLIAAIVVLIAAGIVIGFRIGHLRGQPLAPLEQRLTANSSDAPVYWAALSPNGKLLAYVDPRGLLLREIASGEVHALPLPEGFRAHAVSWFPDGDRILVSAVQGLSEGWGLWSISVLGGTPRKVAGDSGMGSVSPDGKQVAFFRGDKVNESRLCLIALDGGELKKSVGIGGFTLGPPAWSPDGRKLAYLRIVYTPGYSDESVTLETFEPETGKTVVILSDYKLQAGVAWAPDGRILFSRIDEPPNAAQSNIWSLQADSPSGQSWGEPTRLTNGPDGKMVLGLSADGKSVAFLRANVEPTVYVAQVNAKTRGFDSIERLTLDEQASRPYEWTPDGKAVLFLSIREGGVHIYRQELGQASPDLLVGGKESVSILRLNPKGTEILYLADAPGDGITRPGNSSSSSESQKPSATNENSNATQRSGGFALTKVPLMRVPIAGGTGRLLLEETGINNFQCARAPSDTCIFSQFTEHGVRFFTFDSETGAKNELPAAGDPQWQAYNWSLSPDGQMLVLAKKLHAPAIAELRFVPVNGGNSRVVQVKDWAGISTIDWAADGKSMWAGGVIAGETRALLNIDLQGQAKTVLMEKKPYMGWAIPSQDGKKLAFWESTGASNVWMLKGI